MPEYVGGKSIVEYLQQVYSEDIYKVDKYWFLYAAWMISLNCIIESISDKGGNVEDPRKWRCNTTGVNRQLATPFVKELFNL